MGGASVLVSYFIGKEVLDKKCGLFFAFFMAFNVGFMQRTTAGFFDNETVGVFGTLMTVLFYLKAMRTGRITHSILGGPLGSGRPDRETPWETRDLWPSRPVTHPFSKPQPDGEQYLAQRSRPPLKARIA